MPKPANDRGVPFVPTEVFTLCISRVRNPVLRARLQAVRPLIEQAAADYDVAASESRLQEILRPDDVGGLNKDEMVAVYTRRMVPSTQPGRPIYDRILNSAPGGRCPLCDVGVVSTLDHHLPKSKYLALTVTPNNLLPACTWCQDAKDESFPLTHGQQTLHPYFDDFESATWLRAEVVEDTPAAFEFFVDAPNEWNALILDRLERHLTVFKLRELYTSNAGEELLDMRKRLTDLFAAGGAEIVGNHLAEEAATRRDARLNSWRTAMYTAAAESVWFCEGGFAGG